MRPGKNGELILEGNLEAGVMAAALDRNGMINSLQAFDPPLPEPLSAWNFIRQYHKEKDANNSLYMIKDPEKAKAIDQVVSVWARGLGLSYFKQLSRKRFLESRFLEYEHRRTGMRQAQEAAAVAESTVATEE